jgi:formylglycine-generating enzyme required for sulfatase activity
MSGVFIDPTGWTGYSYDAIGPILKHTPGDDAEAYAEWSGKALPTEAEWEFAARGGLLEAEFAWGDEFTPGGAHMANTWQGSDEPLPIV